jgi:hypothetical protein
MRVKTVNNKTGEEQFFEIKGCELLIGSDSVCDIVLEDESVFPQHARLAHVSHHIFLRTKRSEDGTVTAFYGNELNEYGHYVNWKDEHSRIDTREFEVGDYTVCCY